jgi:gliding motility-associated-like protein
MKPGLLFLVILVTSIGGLLLGQVNIPRASSKPIAAITKVKIQQRQWDRAVEQPCLPPAAGDKVVQVLSCGDEYYLKYHYSDTLAINIWGAVSTAFNEQIIVGTLFDFGNAANPYDPSIIKLGTNGEKIWEKNFSVPGSQYLRSVTALADGNYVGVGTDQLLNDVSVFLVKFDGSGNVIWKRTHLFTGIAPLTLDIKKVKEDDAGSLVLVGNFQIGGSPRLLYVKCNSSGTVLLSKSLRPPGPTIIIGASDMLVKDGFTYISGKNYNWNFMNGLLIKINNSTGAVVWAKQYNFNNSAAGFSQVLLYNNQLCLLGLNGNNQSDTNIIILADTSGSVNSSNYFYFPGLREPGWAMARNDGRMVWLQNTSNDFSIAEFNPLSGVLWINKYAASISFPRIVQAFEGDNNSIIFAGHTATANNKFISGKFSENGALPCTGIPAPFTFGSGSTASQDILFAADNFSFQEIIRDWTLRNEVLNKTDTICRTGIACDSIDISAPGSLCTRDTLRVTLYKDCSILPSYTFDTTKIRLISTTDTLLKFVALLPGQVIIRAALDNGCSILRDSVNVIVHKAARDLDLGSDTALCNGNSVLLNSGPGYASYLWQDGSSGPALLVNTTGRYHVTVTDSCGRQYTDSIVVNGAPGIPLSIGPDRVKCNNDTLHLDGPGGYLNYAWSPAYNISSLSAQSVIINPLVDTTYFLKAEMAGGCFKYDTIRIVVNASPAIRLGADTSFCSGGLISLDAGTGFNSYAWSNGGTAQQTSVNSAGVISVLARTSQGCISSDTLRILNVHPLPVVILDNNNTLCTGSSRILDAGAYRSFLWHNGTVARTLPVNSPGTYYVTVTDLNGCSAGDTTVINVLLPTPQQFLPADTSICSYGMIKLEALSNFPSYNWSTGSSLFSTVVTRPGVYWLEVKNDKNCIGRDSVVVFEKQCSPGLFVPSAFTPNMDGKNDVMRAILIGDIKSFEFRIFNRYGQLVFSTRDIKDGWDGTVRAVKQETAGFVWVCTYRVANEPVKIEKGTVLLIR